MTKSNSSDNTLTVVDLGRKSYRPVLDVQKRRHRKRMDGKVPDTLFYVEHDPVYTLGKSASEEHILLSERELDERGVDVVPIERGGDVTYHGPGQVVGYPIFDLREFRRSVSWFMRTLEEVIIQALSTYDIASERMEGRPGVWVEERKICAVGVRISRWVTYHGFALNVDPDMDHFSGIVPCGIQDAGVTSLRDELTDVPDREEVKERITDAFCDQFSFDRVERGDVSIE